MGATPSTGLSDAGLAALVNAATTTGLESYEISQGAPVSISTIGGVGSVSVGNPVSQIFSGVSGTIIVIVLGIIALAFAFRKH